MKRFCYYSICIILICLISNVSYVRAQSGHPHDSSYFETYPDNLVTRLYYSRKFTGFHVSFKRLEDQIFKYRPNTTNNLGIGASYDWLTLNLAYGFDFLNQNQDRGDTKYLDLQSHLYLGKINIDLFGQFYRGYYLSNQLQPDGEIYVRPDLGVVEIGASVQYVFNHRKYSFKAAFQNTEYQKRSAGSWLLGWDMFYGAVEADSSLVPGFVEGGFTDFDRLRFIKSGPSGGYAYTLVIGKSYYLTGSAYLAVNSGVYRLKSPSDQTDEFFVSLDFGVRIAAGYNSRRLNIGGLFVMQEVQAEDNYRNIINTGNFRFIFAYRFTNVHPPILDRRKKN